MAEASISVAQDQFSCPICLDLLKDPVTIPCGHSYCMNCIDDQKRVYSCPQCRQTFSPRPTLNKNVMLAETVEKLKKTKIQTVYCCTDQTCICFLCTMDEHKNHHTVSAEAERTEKQKQLWDIQRKFQQRIQEKEKELQKLKQASSAQAAVKNSERIFTELIRSIERRRSEVIQMIRDREKAEVSRAEGLLEQLKQEIYDLRRRDAELKQLLHTENLIHFLQSFQSLSVLPASTENINISSFFSYDDVRKSISMLEDLCKEAIESIFGKGKFPGVNLSPPDSHQLTLDPNTAHKYLRLSEGNRVATFIGADQRYPVHADRFHDFFQVLCRESVCGRCYWEIEWNGMSGVYISVSYKSIRRKGSGFECGFGLNDQSWRLFCSKSCYSFCHNTPVKLGVYVDHSAGTLSFYKVSDTMTLIHRIQTTFTQPLYPGFRIYLGSTVKLSSP
uniref:Tripartite motif-containing protein 16-like n=1 Tax=Sinocyclocheilus grahami TaxID=75366 RepID=A0A672LEK6_SINGR